jgi:hypothetical protein
MKFNVILYCLAFLILASPAAGVALPQAPTGTRQEEQEEDGALPLTTLVMVRVEVSDRHGKAVADLSEEDFAVYENGIKQRVFVVERGPAEATGLGPNQYRVGYIFKGKPDGTYRKVRVVVRKKRMPGLRVKSSPDGFIAQEKSRP